MDLSAKQQQFNNAMERYNTSPAYKIFGSAISIINVTLQVFLLHRVWQLSIRPLAQVIVVVSAWLLTDFINGLVHMYMDNNDQYESFAGPLIANFHLHHKIPRYKRNSLLIVYFTETGSKVWLVGYLAVVTYLSTAQWFSSVVLCLLVHIGIFSSVAEVSHYLCHTSTSPVARFLGNCGILLSKRHHADHHLLDNINYAFLNGISDPVLNLIARVCCPGYKQTTDQHYVNYLPDERNER